MGLLQSLAEEADKATGFRNDYLKMLHLVAELKAGKMSLDQVDVDLLGEKCSWNQTPVVPKVISERMNGVLEPNP